MPESAAFAAKLAELRGGFKPAPRRDSTGSNASTSGSTCVPDGESEGVRAVVRCRPPPAGAGGEAAVGFAAEPFGRDKVSLKLEASPEVLSKAGAGEDLARPFRCSAFFGPSASQQDVFAEAAPVVEAVMKGCNGAVLCYGATGAGKTHTLAGPGSPDPDSFGMVQRVATRIFEYIRDRSLHGEVFAVEASFLEIGVGDGAGEQLIDLLSEQKEPLEVKADPGNPQSFVCEGLQKVPIRTPDELCDFLQQGQQRRDALEAGGEGPRASRAHSLFTLTVESLAERPGSEPLVHRGKLILGDLAGSEATDRGEPPNPAQVAAVQRSLATLTAAVSRLGGAGGESALGSLLRDCIGGGARAVLVANVGPEAEDLDDTAKTLRFAQQLMAVRGPPQLSSRSSVASQPRADRGSSSLLAMRQRHSECIRILQDKVSDTQEEEHEHRQKLQKEMEDLNKRLLTKESADKTLETMRDEQLERIDEMRMQMTQTMSKELEKMREHSLQDLNNFRQSVEQNVTHLSTLHQQRNAEEHSARVEKMEGELQSAQKGQKVAEDEAAELRVKLASVEERAKMLQARQEELRKERSVFEDERRELRQQSEGQWQKLMGAEHELQRSKAEVEVQKAELERLTQERAQTEDTARQEREAWRAREGEFQQETAKLRGQIDDARREAEVQAIKAGSEQKEVAEQLRMKVERLEDEGANRAEQLAQAHQACTRLDAEKAAALQREETLRVQSAQEARQLQEDLEDAKNREAELMTMLTDIQNSIIFAQANGQGPGAGAAMQRGM